MPSVPALDKKGRFKTSVVRNEMAFLNAKEEAQTARKLRWAAWGLIIFYTLVILSVGVLIARPAHAGSITEVSRSYPSHVNIRQHFVSYDETHGGGGVPYCRKSYSNFYLHFIGNGVSDFVLGPATKTYVNIDNITAYLDFEGDVPAGEYTKIVPHCVDSYWGDVAWWQGYERNVPAVYPLNPDPLTNATGTPMLDTSGAQNGSIPFGNTQNDSVAQRWVSGNDQYICNFDAVVWRTSSSVTDGLQLNIWEGGAYPGAIMGDGRLVTSVTTTAATIPAGETEVPTRFNLPHCALLRAFRSHWFEIKRIGGLSSDSRFYYAGTTDVPFVDSDGWLKRASSQLWEKNGANSLVVLAWGENDLTADPIQYPNIASSTNPTFGDLSNSSTNLLITDDWGIYNPIRDGFNAIFKGVIWLFVPDSYTKSVFFDAVAGIKERAPVGYFYLVANSLSGLSSATGTNPATSYDFNLPNNNTIHLFSLQQIKDSALVINARDLAFPWIRVFLWLGAFFWLFWRVKHVEL